ALNKGYTGNALLIEIAATGIWCPVLAMCRDCVCECLKKRMASYEENFRQSLGDSKRFSTFPCGYFRRTCGEYACVLLHFRTPFAQGVPDRFGGPVVTISCAFLFRTRGCGCDRAPGIPCALFIEGLWLAQLGRNPRRGNTKL